MKFQEIADRILLYCCVVLGVIVSNMTLDNKHAIEAHHSSDELRQEMNSAMLGTIGHIMAAMRQYEGCRGHSISVEASKGSSFWVDATLDDATIGAVLEVETVEPVLTVQARMPTIRTITAFMPSVSNDLQVRGEGESLEYRTVTGATRSDGGCDYRYSEWSKQRYPTWGDER